MCPDMIEVQGFILSYYKQLVNSMEWSGERRACSEIGP